jgi:hypothetical protein
VWVMTNIQKATILKKAASHKGDLHVAICYIHLFEAEVVACVGCQIHTIVFMCVRNKLLLVVNTTPWRVHEQYVLLELLRRSAIIVA